MKMTSELFLTFVIVLLLGGLNLAAAASELPASHPEELPNGRPICTDCHDQTGGVIAFKRYNHTVYFTDNHGLEARQNEEVCAMCHRQSFCTDCHGVGVELKPSLKNQSDTYRRSPHRGEYLSRHRIEGRIDPTSCFRCHGKPRSAERCVRCHG